MLPGHVFLRNVTAGEPDETGYWGIVTSDWDEVWIIGGVGYLCFPDIYQISVLLTWKFNGLKTFSLKHFSYNKENTNSLVLVLKFG